jgi:hypothetical protein
MAKELRENEKLFDSAKQSEAIAPLTNLSARMDQLKQETIEIENLKKARDALNKADTFYEKNGALY